MMHSKNLLRLLTPNISDIIFITVLVIALTPICSYDVWWHLEAGEMIVHKGIPTTDPFSFTSEGKQWVAHEWLSELIFFTVYSGASFPALILMKALIVAISVFLLYKIMLKESDNPLISLLLTPVMAANISMVWTVRPHIFSILFFSVFIYLLLDFWKRPSKRIWLLAPLTIIWANLHGGFVLGLLLIFCFVISSAIDAFLRKSKDPQASRSSAKTLFIVLLLSTICVLFNPNTYELLLYPLQYLGSNIHTSFIAEWQAPLIGKMAPFELLLALLAFALAFSRKRKRSFDLISLGVFGFLALAAQRSVPFIALASAPFLARHLPDAIASLAASISTHRRRLNSIIQRCSRYVHSRNPWLLRIERKNDCHIFALLSLIIIASLFIQTGDSGKVSYSKYPIDASEYLSENQLSGNIFSLYRWGGYLIWRHYPDSKIFIDGRADVHGETVLEDYATINSAKDGWGELLDNYSIDYVLIDRESVLGRFLKNNETWNCLYRDGSTYLFERS